MVSILNKSDLTFGLTSLVSIMRILTLKLLESKRNTRFKLLVKMIIASKCHSSIQQAPLEVCQLGWVIVKACLSKFKFYVISLNLQLIFCEAAVFVHADYLFKFLLNNFIRVKDPVSSLWINFFYSLYLRFYVLYIIVSAPSYYQISYVLAPQ